MNLALFALLYTGLFFIAFMTVRNAGRAGPAGRVTGVPPYQRRTLSAVACVLLCTVINGYLMLRHQTAPRPELAGLFLLDGLGMAGMAAALTGLRRPSSPRAIGLGGFGLSVWCVCVCYAWFAVAWSAWVSPEGAAFLDSASASWGTSPAVVGLISLVHYGFAPVLGALTVAARARWSELPEWKRDHAFRGLANTTVLLALLYLVFTWGVLRG